jgi:hypothetical protein
MNNSPNQNHLSCHNECIHRIDIIACAKTLATKWKMDIGRDGHWKPHVSNSSALSVPEISKAVAAQKN